MHAATSMQLGRVILPYHYDVLSVAADFLAAGKPDVAVIMAQTACEIATEAVISQLLRHYNLPAVVEKWIRKRIDQLSTFHRAPLYELYRDLSGDDFKGSRLWREWDNHITIRNNVAHRGTHATPDQAKRYCEIALDVIHHFESVLARVTAERRI